MTFQEETDVNSEDEDYVTIVGGRGAANQGETTASSPASSAVNSSGEGSTVGDDGAANEANPRSPISSPTNAQREELVPDVRSQVGVASSHRTSTIPAALPERAAGFRFTPDLGHITSVPELQDFLQLVHPGIQTITSPQLGKELLPLESILPRFISSIDPDEEGQIQTVGIEGKLLAFCI